jgi:molecular chaperone GrpE
MPERGSEREVMPPAGAAAPPAERDREWDAEAAQPPHGQDGGGDPAPAAKDAGGEPSPAGQGAGGDSARADEDAGGDPPPAGQDAGGDTPPAGDAGGEPPPTAEGHADGESGDADAGADAPPADKGEPVDEATELREQAGRYLDLAQRTQADFDNYRKRMARDVRAAEARGIGKLARELLPALDNLERALAAVGAAESKHHLSEGIRLVTAELSAALGRTGIEAYSPEGEPFDPSQHEAVAQHPVEGAEQGTVVQVLQAGYRLNDAILRPARVIVAG